MALNTTGKKCFRTMDVLSLAAEQDIWALIVECLDRMTDSPAPGEVDAIIGEADVILRHTLNMEEVRNDLGTEALYLLSNNLAEQDSSLSKFRASTLKRHELVSLLLAIHILLHSVLSEPSRGCSNTLAKDIAESRCLICSAELNTDQQSQCMQKFAEIDEMCK